MAEKIFTVDRFLGLNESADSATELKLGEASKIENFNITDDYNLKTRSGVAKIFDDCTKIKAIWEGFVEQYHLRLIVYVNEKNTMKLHYTLLNNATPEFPKDGFDAENMDLDLNVDEDVSIFSFGDKVYIKGTMIGTGEGVSGIPSFYAVYYHPGEDPVNTLVHGQGPYIPLYLSTADPVSGKGKEVERLNIFPTYDPFKRTQYFAAKIQYSGDGTTNVYKLPKGVIYCKSVSVDNKPVGQYEFDINAGTVNIGTTPAKGVNNVEITVGFYTDELVKAAKTLCKMKHSESYNGATDNRMFFYGDGSNIAYYTGAPAFGSGLYIPAGNEVAVDASTSMITGLRRQGSRLMAFKPDGTFSIDYTTVTLADGSVTAGFYVYPVHRGIGNDMDNQVQTVGNYARTLSSGGLYEWRYAASYHQDERYAKMISQKVAKTLSKADVTKIVTCDDNSTQTYYMFLNDEEGTVLVNRYNIDVWTTYKAEIFKYIKHAVFGQSGVTFATDKEVLRFDPDSNFDAPYSGDKMQKIQSVWESGYMSFGADYLKKHSSNLWISMLPEKKSRMIVTVKTDKRDEYIEKAIGQPLLDFSDISFANFSFLTSNAPKVKRTKIKVKKFIYYKLIFRVSTEGDRATILGYDQQVQYSSAVK
jgi:uncharacterized protein YbcI